MPQNRNWAEKVDEKETYHTPDGTFTKTAPEIVQILMQGASGHPELALRRLIFYMNRAGTNLKNTDQLTKAKAIIEEKIEANTDGC